MVGLSSKPKEYACDLVKMDLKSGGIFFIGAFIENDDGIKEYNDLLSAVMKRREKHREPKFNCGCPSHHEHGPGGAEDCCICHQTKKE